MSIFAPSGLVLTVVARIKLAVFFFAFFFFFLHRYTPGSATVTRFVRGSENSGQYRIPWRTSRTTQLNDETRWGS